MLKFDQYQRKYKASIPAVVSTAGETSTSCKQNIVLFILFLPLTTLTAASMIARSGSYGHTWMRDAIRSRIADDVANRSPRQELMDYLTSGLQDVDDVVVWWGVSFPNPVDDSLANLMHN